MEKQIKSAAYKFSEFCLNPFDRTLHKNDSPVEISSKTFDFLLLLVEKSGETVTKEEILNAVWGESFVEEGNLTVHISKLRKLLGASKSQPLIKTVTGRGYQFVANVELVRELDGADHISSHVRVTHHNPFKPDSIAVLPLRNEYGDEEIDYLADGITESLINSLSYMPDFRVIARDTVFRYKDKDIDAQEIGKTLGVSTVLTGRLRILKENLVIGVELINVEDGTQIWGTHVNQPFSDIFQMQEKIAGAISYNLKSKAGAKGKMSLPAEQTHNIESYRFNLKGRYFFHKTGLTNVNKAIDYFRKSVAIDPTNANSYIQLCLCYLTLYRYDKISYSDVVVNTSNTLHKASLLSSNIAELFSMKGVVEMDIHWNLEQAETNFTQALSLNSNSASCHYYYGIFLANCGRYREALGEINEIMKLDPMSIPGNIRMARLFLKIRDFDNSIIKANEVLELDSDSFIGNVLLGASFAELEKYEQALEALHKALSKFHHYEIYALTGYVYAYLGDRAKATEILNVLLEEYTNSDVSPYYLGFVYSALGEVEKSFEYVENAYRIHHIDMISLKSDTRLKSIRNDPRFDDLLLRIGLPVD